MTENSILNLLIVDRIDAVSQPLRDAGFIVQAERLEQEGEVLEYVKYKQPDLIIARPLNGLGALASLHEALMTADRPVPLFALVDGEDAPPAAALLAQGCDALCDPNAPEHLQQAVRKELDYRQLSVATQEYQHKLKEAEARSRAILDSANEAIAYIHEGVHMYVNPAYLQLFGFVSMEDLEGVTLMNLVSADDRNELKRFLRDSTKQRQALEPLQLRGLRSDGSDVPIVMRCQPTRIDDEPCLQIFVDPVRGDDARDGGTADNHTDPLTGAYNRTFFVDYLNKRLADEDKNSRGVVLYVMIEAYRPLCERFGLAAGDSLVADLSPKLRALLGDNDVLCRFSDAVFCVFLPEAGVDAAQALAQKLCATIKANTSYLGESLLTSNASIGIAPLGDGYDDALKLLTDADRTGSGARKDGGDRAAVVSRNALEANAGDAAASAATGAIEQIHAAISAERMRLLYQPVVSFADDSEQRYQALMQILDESGEPLDMSELGPHAENTNLMLPLDKWALVTALGALTERYRSDGPQPSVFVRISSNAIRDKEFIAWLQQRLHDTGLPGEVLVIEVLEEVAERLFKEVKPFRERLRELGCGFALASFGGKANSERILTHLQPDFVKLESELLEKRAKAKDSALREEVAELTQKAHEMNAQVVAQNISNANQMASIWQFGVTLVQGDMVREADAEMSFDFAEFATG